MHDHTIGSWRPTQPACRLKSVLNAHSIHVISPHWIDEEHIERTPTDRLEWHNGSRAEITNQGYSPYIGRGCGM